MKQVFSTKGFLSRDIILLAMRISISALMLVHGFPKLEMLVSGGPVKFASVFGMGSEWSLAMAVFAEVICSILVLAGCGTRLAVVPLIVTMVVAVFWIHIGDPFKTQELGLHYLLVYIVLFFSGSGKYSADYFISRKFTRTGRSVYNTF